jgi:ComF family protein
LIQNFIDLFYPRRCNICTTHLSKAEQIVCALCQSKWQITPFHLQHDNMVARKLAGRAFIQNAAAMFVFEEGGYVQSLLHHLKYKNQPDIGILLGKKYGQHLITVADFASIDVIIPVPLHPSKQLKRGYNQSEQFAIGLSETMQKPLITTCLLKRTKTQSQTRKGRMDRWYNVKEGFLLENNELITNKKILLVDDVITTGATLDVCVNELLKAANTQVSVACIAAVI